MDEIGAILAARRELGNRDQGAVLATVVHVRGSAYRRPGARMLILPDGRRIGAISGGCLEGDVAKKAWWFTADGRPSVRVYDTSSDEDAVWEFGLGCNGEIQVLLERLSTPAVQESLEFMETCRQSTGGVTAVVIRSQPLSGFSVGDRLHWSPDGGIRGGVPQRWPDLAAHVDETVRERRSRLVGLAGCEVFVEWIAPPQRLVIFGAGHDAIPVASLAKQLGWAVTVVDGRPAYATPARFPLADRVVVMRPENPLSGVAIGKETAVVMMTHNYIQDGRLLREILAARPRYLGMLGPANRADRLLHELGISRESVDVHAPIGLDIGATTPEGIALSIISEIQAELAGRPGMKLRHRRSSIHAPAIEAGTAQGLPLPDAERPVCEIGQLEQA
ncbi:XdhC family protein [Paludibaculum fermentans]|uniref:XdhC family protein n=1 Tax=Paludibaculum fermentans TaxID=1473598 RepID=A0A7S7NUT3_PALFE|nr:XdhC/CoxI family protein [Paludibaculum fermentans]QOY90139.1 XdhC family protein [Paludibaculum fermentans]